jgi:hypothetical protein
VLAIYGSFELSIRSDIVKNRHNQASYVLWASRTRHLLGIAGRASVMTVYFPELIEHPAIAAMIKAKLLRREEVTRQMYKPYMHPVELAQIIEAR